MNDVKNYNNPRKVSDLSKIVKNIDLAKYLEEAGINTESVIISELKYYENMDKLITDENIETINGIKFIAMQVSGVEMNELRNLGDKLRNDVDDGMVVLASDVDGKVNLLCMAGDNALKAGAHAGNIIKAIATLVGGGGGGRPNIAQAGGKNPAGIKDALEKAKEEFKSQLA